MTKETNNQPLTKEQLIEQILDVGSISQDNLLQIKTTVNTVAAKMENCSLSKDVKPIFLTDEEMKEARETAIVYAVDDPRNTGWSKDRNQI